MTAWHRADEQFTSLHVIWPPWPSQLMSLRLQVQDICLAWGLWKYWSHHLLFLLYCHRVDCSDLKYFCRDNTVFLFSASEIWTPYSSLVLNNRRSHSKKYGSTTCFQGSPETLVWVQPRQRDVMFTCTVLYEPWPPFRRLALFLSMHLTTNLNWGIH